MDNSVIVSLRDIVVEFDGQRILDGLTLDIHDKEFVTLLGSSGCGKTTTLRLIAGFLEPNSGKVLLKGEDITGISLMLLFVAYQRFADGVSWLPDTIIGFPTLLIAHIAFNVPYVIFNVSPKLKQLDIKLYEAALDLGCDPKQAFFKVILPEISPAILSAFLICLTYSIDDFMISYFNCGTVETLPIAIYSMTRKKVSPEIYALSTIMFVVILCIILISNAMESRNYRRDQKALRGEGV